MSDFVTYVGDKIEKTTITYRLTKNEANREDLNYFLTEVKPGAQDWLSPLREYGPWSQCPSLNGGPLDLDLLIILIFPNSVPILHGYFCCFIVYVIMVTIYCNLGSYCLHRCASDGVVTSSSSAVPTAPAQGRSPAGSAAENYPGLLLWSEFTAGINRSLF